MHKLANGINKICIIASHSPKSQAWLVNWAITDSYQSLVGVIGMI